MNADVLGQTQQELTGDPVDVVAEQIRAALMNVHTAQPGHVVSYNLVQQTVKVQPGISRLTVDGKALKIAVLPDVPVVFPGGALTFDIASGDECLVIFAERCIDRWWKAGGVQEPAELRFHDLSDGFAVIGPNSLGRLLSSIGAGTELRLRDGSVRVALRDGLVLLGSATASGVELTSMLNGVVLALGIDPYTGMSFYALGASSENVRAKL